MHWTMLQRWIAPQPSVRNDSTAIVGMLAISVYEAWHLGVRRGAKLENGKLGFWVSEYDTVDKCLSLMHGITSRHEINLGGCAIQLGTALEKTILPQCMESS